MSYKHKVEFWRKGMTVTAWDEICIWAIENYVS